MIITKKVAYLALVIATLGGMLFGCNAASESRLFSSSDIPETGQTNSNTLVAAREVKRLPTLAQPTTTPDVGLRSACLAGSWEAQDLDQVMADSFANTHSTLKLEAVEGEMLYQFTEDGRLTIRFNKFSAHFSGEMDGLPIDAYQLLDGSATARYQIDETQDELVLTDFGGEGISAALDINQQRLAEGNLPAWRAFTSGLSNGADAVPTPLVAYARLAVQCVEDQIVLHMVEPKSGPEIQLVRK